MRLNDPNRPVLVTRGIRVLSLVPVVLASFASPMQAQTVLPTQLPHFLCMNYHALRDLAPLIALIVAAAALVHGLVIRRAALPVDLTVAVIIALIVADGPADEGEDRCRAGHGSLRSRAGDGQPERPQERIQVHGPTLTISLIVTVVVALIIMNLPTMVGALGAPVICRGG